MWKRFLRTILPPRLRESLQRRRLDHVLTTYPVRQVRHQYGEGEFVVELSDPLGAGWYDRDWPVLPEIAILRGAGLRTGGVVFDLGAHQGVVALMFAREVGPAGKVIAVEALPHNAIAACRNCKLNAMPWVEVINAGVAASEGTIQLSRSLNAQTAVASQQGGIFEIKATTVDRLRDQYGQPDVVFVDVEGMELDVLRGATRTLEAKPDVFVEVHTRCGLEAAGGSVQEILEFFPADHYDCYVHTESILIPIRLPDVPLDWLRDRFFLTAVSRRYR